MANPIDRTWYNALVDDDGSGTTGTIWNKAQINSLLNAVDASLATVVDKTGGPLANQIALFSDADTVKGGPGVAADPAGGILLTAPTYAYVSLVDQAQPADGRIFRLINSAGTLKLVAMADSGAILSMFEMYRGGRIALTAGQISFPATAIPSADPYTFDDYREGVWAPILGGSGGQSGQTYNQQAGTYRKYGGVCTAQFFTWLATKGTISGTTLIRGLPFAPAAGAAPAICSLSWANLSNILVNAIGWLDPATNGISVIGLTAAAAACNVPLPEAYVTNGSYFAGSITYATA